MLYGLSCFQFDGVGFYNPEEKGWREGRYTPSKVDVRYSHVYVSILREEGVCEKERKVCERKEKKHKPSEKTAPLLGVAVWPLPHQ